MAEKTLKTRIVNKHASLGDWQGSSLVLKEGEIALAKVTTAVKDNKGNIIYVPRYLMKVGDGTNTFANLNWLVAPASDVYEWAKLENPTVDQLPANLKQAIKNLQGSLEAGGTVAGLIKDAIELLDYTESRDDDAENGGVVISAISETNGKISVTRRDLKAADIPDLGAGKITSGTFADERIASADTWNTAATQAQTNKSNLDAEVTARQATDGRVTALEDTIKGLSGAMHFVGVSTTDPKGTGGATVGDQTTFSKGDVCLFGNKEYVYDGTEWIELGDEGSYLLKTEAKNYLLKTDASSIYETIANCDAIRTNVTNLQSDVGGLKTTVGDGTSGLVKDVADLKDSVGTDDNTGLRKKVKALEGTVGNSDGGLVKGVADLVKDVTDLKNNKANVSDLNTLTEQVQTGTFISNTNQFVAYNGDELILDCGGIE